MTQPQYYPIELLHWAAMKEQGLAKIKEILALYPEYINEHNENYDNALMIACKTGNEEICDYLLIETEIDYNYRNSNGNFLSIALQTRNINLFKSLTFKFLNRLEFTKINKEILLQALIKADNSSRPFEYIDFAFSKIKNIDLLNSFETIVHEMQSNTVKQDILKIINMYKLDLIFNDKEIETKIVKI